MNKSELLTEQHLIKLMQDEYHARLIEALHEVDVFDDEGNLMISKDLKVRHKKTQYEYTVDNILGDPATGEVQIALRLPEEPRFEPPPDQEDILIKDKTETPRLLDEDELIDLEISSQSGYEDEEIFVVDQVEFEREYEVK